MVVKELIRILEERFPLAYQESYDNSGLQVGDPMGEVHGILITLDISEKVLEEAIDHGLNMIIAHHPVIFGPLKKLTGGSSVERIVMRAIQENIYLYVMHTNLDNGENGLNDFLGRKLGIESRKVLRTGIGKLKKLGVYCPEDHLSSIRSALFEAGGGRIGQYDQCGFQTPGIGTFRPLSGSEPFIGSKGEMHEGKEIRLEMVVHEHHLSRVLSAMRRMHPYEEIAYDVITMENSDTYIGTGVYGDLNPPMTENQFLERVKERLGCQVLRSNGIRGRKIRKVAVCGGSGAFLIADAVNVGADALVTADIKYHQFSEAPDKLFLIDAGHYETEKVMMELIYDEIRIKFTNFACRISTNCDNPVKYL